MSNLHKHSILITAALFINSANLLATENHSYNLQQAIDYALIHNPNLQIMQDRIGQAEAR